MNKKLKIFIIIIIALFTMYWLNKIDNKIDNEIIEYINLTWGWSLLQEQNILLK